MKKIAILTGATGGLGREFLKHILNEEIDEVWAIARNEQRLSELYEQYGEKVVPISIEAGARYYGTAKGGKCLRMGGKNE